MTNVTEIASGVTRFRSEMTPLDIPITFADDGTFTGEAEAQMQGAGVAGPCGVQSGASVRVRASGEAVQTEEEQHLTVKLEAISAVTARGSANCPFVAVGPVETTSNAENQTFNIEMKGDVGEVGTLPIPSPGPGISIVARIEIVRR